MPLFTGGRLRGNLKLAEARFEESVAVYQSAVQGAFRDVSDSLIAYQRTQEYRARQEQNTQAHRDATATANDRYEGGVTSYLEVLYNEQELFNLQCWALTCESFFDTAEWIWLYQHFGYTGDYEFIYFE